MIEIQFQPEGKHVRVAKGTMLSQAVTKAGIPLDFPCGGQGNCGKCKVRILWNPPTPGHADMSLLSEEERARGFRLACQTRVTQPMIVEVPKESLLADAAQILVSKHDDPNAAAGIMDPPLVKHRVQLAPPTLEDDRPDLQRLCDALGGVAVDMAALRELPTKLRNGGFRGTAVLSEGHLIDFEPDDTASEFLGVAFDVGTTTLVGVLIDLTNGRELAAVSRMNPQTRFGDDVISRIQRVRENKGGLIELHRAVVEALNAMIGELCAAASVRTERIYHVVFSGNTTMLHLLAAVTPAALGELPFVPAMRHSLVFPASDIGLSIHPRSYALTFPVIGGFVGGDTIAGILVTRIAEAEHPTMLVDIGTNGELALKYHGRLLAASCAAGPAFEGATISSGMRATVGAIEEVVFENGVRIRTIGGAPAAGLCGSALIDLTAELLRWGILTPEGLLLQGNDLPAQLPDWLRDRVIDGEGGPEFVVASPEQCVTGRPVTVTHRDLRSIQLGTAAVRAGMRVLLSRNGLTSSDLDCLLVAGAFGNYIRPRNAQRMGLLPHDMESGRIRFVGNTSLAGARMVLLSKTARARVNELATFAEHVELSRDPNFQTAYVESMFFPTEEASSVG